MNTSYFRKITIFLLLLTVWGFLITINQVTASDPCARTANKIDHGGMLWTEKAIIVQGTAVPDLSRSNQSLSIIKQNTKRAATLDAYRKAAGILAGVRLTSDMLAGDAPGIITKIDAYVKRATICKSKFYADGGVDVVVKLPITAAFAMDQLRNVGTDPASGASEFTGLIVDASHLVFAPALVPRLLRSDGSVVFSAEKVRKNIVLRGEAVSYAENLATVDPDIIGANPLKTKAIGLGAASPSDLIIDADTASILEGSPAFISSGKIVIIIGERKRIACKDIAATVKDTKIDWENRVVLARGNGRVNFGRELDNAVRMRMMEEAAVVDAQRKLLKTALQIKMDGKSTLGERQDLVERINGTILNAVRCDAKYFRDGSSEVVMAAPFAGLIAAGKSIERTVPPRIDKGTDIKVTGIIIDVTGRSAFVPVLEPMLLAPDGSMLYGPDIISRPWVGQYGVVGYRSSLNEAQADQRVGALPLVIKPVRIDNDNPAKLVVGPDDAARLRDLGSQSDILMQGRVVIVTNL